MSLLIRCLMLAFAVAFFVSCTAAAFDMEREAHPCDGLTGEAMTSCADRYQELDEEEMGQWP